jgi:hypothetical protein
MFQGWVMIDEFRSTMITMLGLIAQENEQEGWVDANSRFFSEPDCRPAGFY